MKNYLGLLLGLLPLVSAAGPAAVVYSTPPGWDLTATFPAAPKVESAEEQSPIGRFKMVTVASGDERETFMMVQMVLSHTAPADQLEAFYEIAKQGKLGEGQGVLTKEEKIAVADHNGRRWLIAFPEENKLGDFRVTLIGQTLYLAGYQAPDDGYSKKRAKAFFLSIRPRTEEADATGDSAKVPTLSSKSSITVHRAPPAPPPAARFGPGHWALDGAFSGTPNETFSEYPASFGTVRQATRAVIEDQVMFGISRLTFPVTIPDDQVAAIFESTKKNLLARGAGSLMRDELISIAGLVGRRYVIEYTHDDTVDDYCMDYRLVMIDQSIYLVFYRAPKTYYSAAGSRVFFKSVKRITH